MPEESHLFKCPIPACGVGLLEVYGTVRWKVLGGEIFHSRSLNPLNPLVVQQKCSLRNIELRLLRTPLEHLILKFEIQIIQGRWPELKNKPGPEAALTGLSVCIYPANADDCQESPVCLSSK